ncbi:serine/threonine protein kinase [Bacillus sp. CGMCC 1.16607]|uniref:serine/threonine protein kinase n=1 Tax=Bacillus sp. CGMCC 1.16607 TaxID=3351842 RepID=UPI00363D3591
MFNLFYDLIERPLKEGHILQNRYQIIQFIGKGGYGIAYKAEDQLTGQFVVVKQLRKRKRKSRNGQLEREAKILTIFSHSSIPSFIDFFQEDNKIFLIMEHMNGKNVEDLIFLYGHKYNEENSFRFLLKVLQVVKYLHDNEIIHRDLRLPNILIDDQHISIIDFGLAAWIHEKDLDHLSSMPMEKRLLREVSFQSDFYALGHFVLFLLYSTYETFSKQENSWEEELVIKDGSRRVIRKLLNLETGYENVTEIINDVEKELLDFKNELVF